MKNGKLVIFVFILLFNLCAYTVPTAVYAQESYGNDETEMVFLLDASKSMGAGERWQQILDGVFMVSEALPENYRTALIVYNAEIVCTLDFGEVSEESREQLKDLEMKGYSNPAVALKAAGEMLRADHTAEKRIIFVSDGEISMKGEAETEEAVQAYKSAVEALDGNIRLDMFLIPDEETEDQISDAVKKTSGTLLDGNEKSLMEKAEEYLFDILNLTKIDLGVSNADEGSIQIDLQDTVLKNCNVILLAEHEIEEVHITGQFEQLNITQGNRYAIAKMAQPLNAATLLNYKLNEKGKIHAYLIKEYEFYISIEQDYLQEQECVEIRIDVQNHEGKHVLKNTDIAENLKVYLSGEETDYRILEESAVIAYPLEETQQKEIALDFHGLNSRINNDGLSEPVLLEVPVIEEEPDDRILWAVLFGLFAAIVFIVCLYIKKNTKKKTEPVDDVTNGQEKEALIGYDLSGKISLYVIKSPEDIPPSTLKLYGQARKSFRFTWAMECCRLQMELEDADKIRFSGGKDHTLCVKNQGKATLVKNNEVFLHDTKYHLHYGEKLLLIFNDGEIEIELHYKNIKPSER